MSQPTQSKAERLAQCVFRIETNLSLIERRLTDETGKQALEAVQEDLEKLKTLKQELRAQE